MGEQLSHSDSTADRADPDVPPKAPRWAKVLAIVAVGALVVAFVLMHTTGGGMGGHG